VAGRVAVVDGGTTCGGPGFVFGWNFGGDVKFFGRVCAENQAEESFAAAVAVGSRSVKKIATEIGGTLQRAERFVVLGAAPSAHSPHAVANVADLLAGATESPILQGLLAPLGWMPDPAVFAEFGV
jgi:hypothetical protein